LPASIDLQTGRNFQVAKKEFLDLRTDVPTASEQLSQEEFRVPLSSGTSVDSQDFHIFLQSGVLK
jgi:hypothetical protein